MPLHPELIRLGFLDYVRSQGSNPETPIFPAIRVAVVGVEAGKRFSMWWGREVRKIIPDTRKVFHSFRHTMKAALRNAGVDKTLQDAVMGHDAEDVAERYGLDADGDGYALPTLAKAIGKISYPGLAITMVPPAAPGAR